MNDNHYPSYEDGTLWQRVAKRAGQSLYVPVEFAMDWALSRNWKALLMGLPAILVGGIATGLLVIGWQTPPKSWLDVYTAAAASALNREDFAAAKVYFRRMAMIDASTPKTLYGLALTAAREGDEARARSLMRRMAPEDAAGYPLAHLWLARDMLKQGTKLTPRMDSIVAHHLMQARAGDENNAEVHLLLARLYLSRGEVDNAIREFETASRERPEVKLTLAAFYALQKKTAASEQAAVAACNYFRQKCQSKPKALEYRLQWARGEVLQGHYAEAVDILQAGLGSSGPSGFRDALADVYVCWCESILDGEKGGLAKRLELLNLALAHNPKSPQALTLLADLATKDGEAANKARAELEQALARGAAPAFVHAILGTQALRKGDIENARMHLELAYERNPQTPAILNNLAWAFANGKKPDLERALQLAQAAKKLSNHPEISDTIGTILARMGKRREAVNELETALRAFPDRPALHDKLAELYQQLGDAELANLHRRLAKPEKASP